MLHQISLSIEDGRNIEISYMNVLITTIPFGQIDTLPIEILKKNNINYTINPIGRKLTENELFNLVPEYDILIAGTEPITKKVIENNTNLKMISRVGIGLDSVDLLCAREHDINVSYTPDAPSSAVSELAFGMIFNLVREVHKSNIQLHNGTWERYFGSRVKNLTIGVVGAGRIGMGLVNHLINFGVEKILVNDIDHSILFPKNCNLVDKDFLLKNSDVISLNVPLTKDTFGMIGEREFRLMKDSAFIINTSRGGIINEDDLFFALSKKIIRGAAVDTFEIEPYYGKLCQLDNCLLTSHMGSMSYDCRGKMEIEATEEVIRFINSEKLLNSVPDFEYENQELKSK